MAFLAKEIYSGDGVNQNFNVPFGYISKDHVIVAVDGVETTAFTFTSDTIIQITTPPPSGTNNVTVFRRTGRSSRITDYADATSLTEGELDNDSLQAFYILQEFLDEASIQLTQDSTGVWDALNKTIINLADPVNAQDAATKNWVESNASFGADQIADGSVSDIEYQYLDGVTNNIQTQINSVSGVGSPTASVTQASSLIYGTTGGSADTYTLTLSPAPTTNPKLILAKFHVANTGASTINVNSLGVVTITKQDGSALSAGDIPLDSMGVLVYDGTNYQIVSSFIADEQVEVNRSNIFRAFEEIQENHGGALLMEAGWSDTFGNANEQGADEANSSDYQHDNTNKLYKGTDAGTGLNSDKDYTTESNYLQQEWTNSLLSTGQATVTNGDATVTLVSGSWPTNCAKGRISFDSGSTWYDIDSRTDATNIELGVVATESTANYDYIIRMSEFNSGVIQLNSDGGEVINEQDLSATTTTGNVKGNTTNDFSISTQFKATSADPISKVLLRLREQGTPTGNMVVKIQTSTTPTVTGGDPSSTVATSSNVSATTLGASFADVEFNVSYTPTLNNFYYITLERDTSDITNYVVVQAHTGTGGYSFADGVSYQSSTYTHGSEYY
jgi:hypothetical protein